MSSGWDWVLEEQPKISPLRGVARPGLNNQTTYGSSFDDALPRHRIQALRAAMSLDGKPRGFDRSVMDELRLIQAEAGRQLLARANWPAAARSCGPQNRSCWPAQYRRKAESGLDDHRHTEALWKGVNERSFEREMQKPWRRD